MSRQFQARTPEDAAAVEAFDRRMALPLVIAATFPLFFMSDSSNGWLAAAVFISSWIVFLVDFVVHERRLVRYLHTWWGRFDLAVVVLTAPWFLIRPDQAKFVVIVRVARLARVIMATTGARRLAEQLGRVVFVALGVVVLGAAVAYGAEHKTNPEFGNYGDALWWAVVTLTTVGYGDIVPATTAGRVTGVMIMITGIGIIGVLAGSLAGFFGLVDKPGGTAAPDDATPAPTPAPPSVVEQLNEQIVALRAGIAQLTEEVARLRNKGS